LRLRLRARKNAGSVLLRRVNVLDGEHARRPTEALNLIRTRIAASPEDATMWRHLGNIWNRFGNLDAAAEAWERAVAVGKDEFPAALSLALLAAGRGDSKHATPMLVQALSRIGGLKAPEFPGSPSTEELADLLLDLLDSYADAFTETTLTVAWAPPAARLARSKSIVLTMSDIHLQGLEHWDRLGEFLASGAVITAALQEREPDNVSVLQRFLDSDRSFDELFVVRQPPSPPRWISSSKKKKRAGKP
jgi:tetratricopeptide (TPR) repeat protein